MNLLLGLPVSVTPLRPFFCNMTPDRYYSMYYPSCLPPPPFEIIWEGVYGKHDIVRDGQLRFSRVVDLLLRNAQYNFHSGLFQGTKSQIWFVKIQPILSYLNILDSRKTRF
ncbi:hypothetical protein J6590_003103 [Homalodisca vitripennis]|nr:hypothetical protein J6590_003103 [Homalodisca vitripennis]